MPKTGIPFPNVCFVFTMRSLVSFDPTLSLGTRLLRLLLVPLSTSITERCVATVPNLSRMVRNLCVPRNAFADAQDSLLYILIFFEI